MPLGSVSMAALSAKSESPSEFRPYETGAIKKIIMKNETNWSGGIIFLANGLVRFF